MTERWGAIQDYTDYEVSNLGRVRRTHYYHTSKKRKLPYILTLNRNGAYPTVQLCEGGKVTRYSVHRLVALAFIGAPPTPLHEVAHNDGIRDNNLVGNLRWTTKSENEQDKRDHGTLKMGTKHYKTTLTEDDVREMRRGTRYKGYGRFLARKYGVSDVTISQILTGKRWQHVS